MTTPKIPGWLTTVCYEFARRVQAAEGRLHKGDFMMLMEHMDWMGEFQCSLIIPRKRDTKFKGQVTVCFGPDNEAPYVEAATDDLIILHKDSDPEIANLQKILDEVCVAIKKEVANGQSA